MSYLVQQHGEWSEMSDVLDLDFEADTLEEARRIITDEIPKGCVYLLYRSDGDSDTLIEEGTA